MNPLALAIFFFCLLFAGSLAYSVKSKKATLVSYLINIEVEYILVGALIFYLGALSGMPDQDVVISFLYIVLTSMGLIIGTHFSAKLMQSVPKNIFGASFLIYFAALPFLYLSFLLAGFTKPVMYAIIINTMMPYSVNLGARLFKINRDRIFMSCLISSIFPFFTMVFYTFFAGLYDYRPYDFGITIILSILMALIFARYGKTSKRKVIHKVSIMFVFVLAGIANYMGISPLVVGFLAGFFMADSGYGHVFHSITVSFERFFYIFFYIVLGFFLAISGGAVSWETYGCFVSVMAILYLVRTKFAKYIIPKMMPDVSEYISLITVGILPVALILDYGTREGFEQMVGFTYLFFLVHITTEIISYRQFKYEKQRN